MRTLWILWCLLVTALLVVPAQATAASPSVIQAGKQICLANSDTVSLSKSVAAGDTLVLIVGGQGYAGAASVVTSVSDPVNGAWTQVANTGSITSDETHYLSFAVYETTTEAVASGLSITVTSTSGQSAASAVALEVNGSVDVSTSQAAIQNSSNDTLTAPSAPAGDLLVGLFSVYQYEQGIAAGTGWTLNGLARDCSAALAESQALTSSASPTVTVDSSTRYVGGTIAFNSGGPPPPPSPPGNTALPTISGTPQQGDTLAAGQGTWTGTAPISYSYLWSDGTTGSTDTLSAADVGQKISVTVTATNAAGSAQATSASVGPVVALPSPPVNTAVPVVSGSAQQSDTLTTTNGTWTNNPSGYTYAWQDCGSGGNNCVNISGATSSRYTLAASDVAATIRAVVTATNAGGSTSAMSAQTATVTAPTSGGVIPPMPVISHGLPAYGEGMTVNAPSNGVSNDYGSPYRCTPTCALDLDLSSVPLARRQHAVVSWYNDDSLYYAGAIGNNYYNEPRDYTIDVNSASGGGSPPTIGWTTLVIVTGNFYSGGEHFLNLAGANWIRMRVTAVNGSSGNTDASFKLDVHDATAGNSDTWLILGDSITEDDMGHYEPSNFMQQVNAAFPAYLPSEINGGIGGWDASSPLQTDSNTGHVYIDEFLASFPGRYVSLDYGTNDANEGGSLLANYTSNMTALINKVIAAGKIPIVRRSIPWGCTANIEANGPTINQDVQNLLAQYPQAIAGPDEWSYFQAHESLISSDCIHPTIGAGNAAYRQVYVNALLADGLYGSSTATAPANTTPPTISGTAQQGDTLTASNGTWTGTAPITYTYLWSDGTTGSTDTLSAVDVGKNITVAVTATNAAGSATATSAAVGPVVAPPPPNPPVNTAVPVVSGTTQQGDALTTTNGSWTNSPTSYSYQWQDCDGSGANCSNISGATNSSYTLTSGDVTHTSIVVVKATNAGGSASASSAATAVVTAPSTELSPLHVSGNELLNANNNVVQLHGVDRSGTEYACIQGWGIFDGPNVTNDDSQAPLMKAWNANAALIGLNEDCWLGISGVPSAYGGQNYINAIVHETKTLEANGIHPIIALFWSAPGTSQAAGQAAMPDNDHSPAFWQSVANTFKGDPNVILRLKEEPYPGGNSDSVSAWQCWSAGDAQYGASGSLTPISSTSHCSEGYQSVGMQSLINIVRGTGAKNVIQVPGVQYANSMTHFLDSGIRPTDALSPPQLMADVDVYPNGNICGSTSCYDSDYAPVAAQMPFMFGEFGESVGGSDCTVTGVDALMSWADQHGASYSAWDWDTWGGCLQLITDYTTGNPNGNWGAAYKNHLASLP